MTLLVSVGVVTTGPSVPVGPSLGTVTGVETTVPGKVVAVGGVVTGVVVTGVVVTGVVVTGVVVTGVVSTGFSFSRASRLLAAMRSFMSKLNVLGSKPTSILPISCADSGGFLVLSTGTGLTGVVLGTIPPPMSSG